MKIKSLEDSYKPHIVTCRLNTDYAQLAVLSDVHEGLNNRAYLKQTVNNLLNLGSNCKVILGGDSTNTTTKHSKGSVLEESLVGDEQVYALVEDIQPLYDSGQLIGVIGGNHGARAYNDAYISVEQMICALLGDRSLYKGEYCYVHHILHKNRRTKNYYDYFNADVTWFEHFHEPSATPKIAIEHNKYSKNLSLKRFGN